MSLLVIAVAVFGLVVSDNLIRKVMCLTILESMVVLSFVAAGHGEDRLAPILDQGAAATVDPVPQALVLTALVIGVCFDSLALAFIVQVYRSRRTLKASELHEL